VIWKMAAITMIAMIPKAATNTENLLKK
jgi:hypothetical protein